GRHGGRLIALPGRAGTEFALARGFAPGELVRVSARLTPTGGDRQATRLSFSFRIAVPVSMARSAERHRRAPRTGIGPTQHFRSEPDLRPPVVVVTADPDHTSGDVFLAMQNSPQVGPMIIDGQGQLVWFHPIGIGTGQVFPSDLAVQHYQGRPVLTWWQGRQLGAAKDVVMNRSYRTVAVVRAGDGYQADFHEFQLTPQGTALLDAVGFVKTNLTSVGGPRDGTLLDDVIQEVDVRTGQVLWEWHALGHVPLTASYVPYSSNQPFYDYFHLNSIQQLPGGNLLISARHTWALYEISRRTGNVIWTLGGKDSNFTMGPGTNFEWQHDARLRGQTLSLFDDGAYPAVERQSSAKYLRVNVRDRTVSLIRRFTHSPPLLAGAAGSTRTLPNGDVFVGWGELPVFSEYTPTGRQIFNGTFALGVTSYRAFRFAWVGRPRTRPSLAVSRSHGVEKLYASWNGATQVRAWRVLAGPTARALKALGVSVPRRGFETRISVAARRRYVAVQALGRNGDVLGTSAPVRSRL
ncbi:MAG TPA: arylsulfotransferase family protein, partial [Solirubrobacteraceae bacterium]|nr:arylsulfotransferase family protein [Solirubrobacteraceae bacterium]